MGAVFEAATYSGKCQPFVAATGHPTSERLSTKATDNALLESSAPHAASKSPPCDSSQVVHRTGAARDVCAKVPSRNLQERPRQVVQTAGL